MTFAFKAPRSAVASPFAVAVPVRGCVGWHELGHPDLTARYKNLAGPLEAPGIVSPDPQAGYVTLEGKTGKRIQTQIAETADITVLMLVKSDAALGAASSGAACRVIANYNSGTPAGLSVRLYSDRAVINSNGMPSEMHVSYSNITAWKLLAMRIKAGDYLRTDNFTEDRKVTTSQVGITRALGVPFRLGSSVTTDTTSEAVKLNHLSVFNRALTDEELDVLAALVRLRAAAVGISE